MPSSRPDAIPIIGEIIYRNNPETILDVGVGFGLWGVLFRAWTDIRMAEIKPQRYDFSNWKAIIHGIEIYRPYDSMLWPAYNEVFVNDALGLLSGDEEPNPIRVYPLYKPGYTIFEKDFMGLSYDHIHMGDIIEHYSAEDGIKLLEAAKSHLKPGGYITVVTPDGFRPQAPVLGNKHEEHKSGWSADSFKELGAINVWKTMPNNMLVALFQGEE